MMRERSQTLLDAVEADTLPFPDLLAALRNIREELEREERLAADRLSPQPVDRGHEPVDRERMR